MDAEKIIGDIVAVTKKWTQAEEGGDTLKSGVQPAGLRLPTHAHLCHRGGRQGHPGSISEGQRQRPAASARSTDHVCRTRPDPRPDQGAAKRQVFHANAAAGLHER
jgi:hypothetical protein